MDLNKLRDEAHSNAVAKGFWDEQIQLIRELVPEIAIIEQ